MEPITLIKNGITHSIERLQELPKPFSFLLADGKQISVDINEQPIFFARKRMRMSSQGKIKEHFIHRFCVGTKTETGETYKHWVFPNGSFDIAGENPSN